jgi:hypothetical protein
MPFWEIWIDQGWQFGQLAEHGIGRYAKRIRGGAASIDPASMEKNLALATS